MNRHTKIPSISLEQADGKAKHVGTKRPFGDFRLTGQFSHEGNIDLSVAQLVIDSVLNELEGTGELLPGDSPDRTGFGASRDAQCEKQSRI